MQLLADTLGPWSKLHLQLVLATITALEINIGATRPDDPLIVAVLSALSLGVAAWITSSSTIERWFDHRPRLKIATLAGICLAPIVWNLVGRGLMGLGAPLEVVLLYCLRNAVFCSLLAARPSSMGGDQSWIALLGGAAGCVAALALPNGQPAVPWLAGLYLAIAGSSLAWLTWQQDTAGRLTWTSAPWLPLSVLAGISFAVAALLTPTTWNANPPLAQWLASSGGTQRYDESAQGGVGSEGADQVDATEDADSDGGQGDVFIESHLPTFYDVLNDMAGEPFLPKHRNQAIGMQGAKLSLKSQHSKHHQAARKFSIYRQTPSGGPKAKNIEADALLYVRGSTPLYLPMTSYVAFDGEHWIEQDEFVPPQWLTAGDHRWIDVRKGDEDCRGSFVGASSYHSIKIGQFRSDRMPVPLGSDRFRCGLASEPRLFRTLADGGIGVAGESGLVPPGETVEAYSRQIRTSVLRTKEHLWDATNKPAALLQQLEDPAAADVVRSIANDWLQGANTPWEQVEAIVHRLRSGAFAHDNWGRPSGDRDAIVEFLTVTHRGPDFLFAAAAAALLRASDVPCRLVSGYYVRPDKFDYYTAATPVHDRDLHFWVEVYVGHGNWVTVEPTPGYELPPDVLTWQQWMAELWSNAAAWCRGHWLFCLVMVGLVLWAGWRRRWLANVLATASWYLAAYGSPQDRVAWTLWLVERRAAWQGQPRPRSKTLQRWYRQENGEISADCQQSMVTLLDAADLLLYGDANLSTQLDSACRTIVRSWRSPFPWAGRGWRRSAGDAQLLPQSGDANQLSQSSGRVL